MTDDLYTWRLALYWLRSDMPQAGWDVMRNAWYGMLTDALLDLP